MKRIAWIAMLAACMAAPAWSGEAPAEIPVPKELSSEQEAAAIRFAETTGIAMYRHDQAASVATDAALKLREFREDKRVRGWITQERDGQIVVTFLDATPAALYRIPVPANGVAGDVVVLESPTPLSAYESGAAAARANALKAPFQACSKGYNSLVMPAASAAGGDWVVYLLPATTRNDIVPIGGTYRIETNASGITGMRPFTRSCIALQMPADAQGLMITHLLDAVPTEAHVFWSLWADKPLYVSTPGGVWAVERGTIRRVERMPGEG